MVINMEILSIIPARGGSKGLPKKNIKMLQGMPLISYSIKHAFKSFYIDKTVVSSEDSAIINISKEYGAEVIFRPKKLAEDDSKTIDVIIHALDYSEDKGYYPKIIVVLQPTSPLRTSNDIDSAIELFFNNSCDSVVSVCEFDHSPYWALKLENNYLSPMFGQEYLLKPRQELPTAYIPNGALFISSPDKIRKYRSFYCPKTIPYIMPTDRSIDIDSTLDFKMAEILLEEQNANQY
jgi:CMP-N-acetylneuraminic acid synthetase